MLISHESPICLLPQSLKYNDYDYCLVHLLEDNPEYLNYFRTSVNANREVVLDNSIFELGKAFDSVKFAKWVETLRPTYYIVPDVLEDCAQTIHQFIDFIETYTTLPGMKMGVVQGKTYQEIVECYKFMCEYADYVAISFDYSFYQTYGLGTTDLQRMMNGRQRLITSLIQDGIWNINKPVHLLGCSLPQEFQYYRLHGINNIRSVDTSNPIMAGITGMRYASTLGLNTKPKGLLADNLHIQIDLHQRALIEYNIECFRNIVQ